jgi:hypothetical protein
MTEVDASKHKWGPLRAGVVECEVCQALASVIDGTHYREYPGDSNRDCEETRDDALCAVMQGAEFSSGGRILAEVGRIRVSFPEGSAPAYVAAVLRAL